MSLSLITFATIEAAAIDKLFLSPRIIETCLRGKFKFILPSISNISGLMGKLKKAFLIANVVALLIFISSIVSSKTTPMPTSALSIICEYAFSLEEALRRLESSIFAVKSVLFNTTHAAVTGPARGPLPASSRPATHL